MDIKFEMPVVEGVRLIVEEISHEKFHVSVVEEDREVKFLRSFKSLVDAISYCESYKPWIKMNYD